MNYRRIRRKKSELKSHRVAQYEKSLDGLIEGKIPVEYVTKRWYKLKDCNT